MTTLFQGPSSSHVRSAGGKGSDTLFSGDGFDLDFRGAQCRCRNTFHPPPSHAHISLFHGTYCTTYSLLITVDAAAYSYCIPLPCSQDLHGKGSAGVVEFLMSGAVLRVRLHLAMSGPHGSLLLLVATCCHFSPLTACNTIRCCGHLLGQAHSPASLCGIPSIWPWPSLDGRPYSG